MFTTSANLSSASGTWTVPAGVSSIAVLVVGGGGSGSGGTGGGGGAGGLIFSNGYAVTPGAGLSIAVGAGGDAPTASAQGVPGGNTVFDTLTALGGEAADDMPLAKLAAPAEEEEMSSPGRHGPILAAAALNRRLDTAMMVAMAFLQQGRRPVAAAVPARRARMP